MSDFLKKRKVGDTDFNPIEYNGPQVKKAKRGRPRKHPLPVPAQPTMNNTNVLPPYTMLAPIAAVKPLSGPPSPNIPLVSRDQLTPAVKPRRPRSSSGAGVQESPTNKPTSEDTKAKKSALLARVTSLPVISLKGKPAPLLRQDHVENKLPLSWRRKAKFASISSTLYGNDKLGKDDDELKRMDLDLDSDLVHNVDKPRRGRPPKRGRGRPPKNSDLPNAESGDGRMNGQGAINSYADPDYELDDQAVQPSELQYMSRRAPPLRTLISKDWQSLYEQFVKQFGSVKEATELSTDALEQFYFKMIDILERHTTPKEEIDLLRDETRDIREEFTQSLYDGLQHVESCRVKLQLELQQLRLKLHSDQLTVRQHNATKLDALLQHLEQQMNLDRLEIARQIKKIREDSERYLTIQHVPTPPPMPNMAMSGPAAMMSTMPATPRDQQLRAQRELASKQHQQAADLYNQAVQLFNPAPYHPGYMSPHQMGPHLPGPNFNQGYEGYMSQHNIEIPRSFVTSQRSPVTAPNLAFPNTHLPNMHGYKPQDLQMTHVVNYHDARPQLPPLLNYQENASVILPPIAADRVPSPVKSRDALSSTSNPDRRDAESRDQISESKSEVAPMQVEEKSTSQNTDSTVTRVNAESADTKVTPAKDTPAQDSSPAKDTSAQDIPATPVNTDQSKNSTDTSTPMTGVTSESAPVNNESAPLTEVPEAVTQSYDMLVQSLQQLTGNSSLTAEQLSELIAQQSGIVPGTEVWEEEQVQEEGSIQTNQQS